MASLSSTPPTSQKAQPLHELYGFMDPETRDWTDGVLSRIFRELNQPLPPNRENEMRWLIYDGDVDALWVENMNSVMDDNKLLTLPNGERIRLQPHCAQLIEVFDLQYASPATISRCGMVWVDPKNLGFQPYFERWVKVRCGDGVVVTAGNEDEAALLTDMFDRYVPACIAFVLKGMVDGEMGEKLKLVIPITDVDLVKQLCSCVDAFLPKIEGGLEFDAADTEGTFIFGVLWSMGAALVGNSRIRFDAFLKKLGGSVPSDGTLYDYVYDPAIHGWEAWSARVPDYVQPAPFKFYSIMVPTTDSVLGTFLLQKLAPLKPILYVGESGTAKTLTIQNYMRSLDPEANLLLSLNMSSGTNSRDVQSNLENNVDKRSGAIYGPPAGKKLIVFLDDLNMPFVDTYGTQQPITLLQTLMSRGFFYDRGKDLNQKILKDLDYIAAMGPPGGGRNPVTPRFIALFNVFNLTEPTAGTLDLICSNIITTKFEPFASTGVKEAVAKFPKILLRVFAFIVGSLPPTPSKFHYIFNLRDISRVTEGVCLATEDKFADEAGIVRLLRNECQRVFCDRLATMDDIKAVSAEVDAAIKDEFASSAGAACANPIIYGDYAMSVARLTEEKEDPQLYEDLGDYSRIQRIFEDVLEAHNAERKPMQLVMFEMALEHVTRIMRIIRLPVS